MSLRFPMQKFMIVTPNSLATGSILLLATMASRAFFIRVSPESVAVSAPNWIRSRGVGGRVGADSIRLTLGCRPAKTLYEVRASEGLMVDHL